MSSDADKQQRGSDGGSGDGAPPTRERQRLDGELERFEPVSDGLVLAAVERAEGHREREGEGVMMSDIAEHLGFVHGSWTTRRLRPQLDALIAEGSLARSRCHGVVVWALTEAGRGHWSGCVGLARSGSWQRLRSIVHGAMPVPGPASGSTPSVRRRERHWRTLRCCSTVRTRTRMRGSASLSAFRRRVGASVRPRTASTSGASPTTPGQT